MLESTLHSPGMTCPRERRPQEADEQEPTKVCLHQQTFLNTAPKEYLNDQNRYSEGNYSVSYHCKIVFQEMQTRLIHNFSNIIIIMHTQGITQSSSFPLLGPHSLSAFPSMPCLLFPHLLSPLFFTPLPFPQTWVSGVPNSPSLQLCFLPVLSC